MTKVIKRNGEVVDYDGNKIILAISKAMAEGIGINEEIAEDVESRIYDEISNSEAIFTVDDINSMIEIELMKCGKYNTAKRFILYREERKKAKTDIATYNYKYISQEFLEKYRKTSEPFNTLGSFVLQNLFKILI